MKKRLSISLLLATFLITFIVLPANPASADPAPAKIADGTYKINYEIKQSGSGNTSIADGYFKKPATLTVKGNTQTIQLTVSEANYVKSLSVQGKKVATVSESGTDRVVKFNVSGDLSEPVKMSMRIKVPDLYDTTHGADAVFDVSDLEKSDDPEEEEEEGATKDTNEDPAEKNPPTGDNTPLFLYAALLIGAMASFLLVRKFNPTNN